MTIHYVKGSLRPTKVTNQLDTRIYLKLKLWAEAPPLEDVVIRYKFSDSYTGPYAITEGTSRTARVTGTQANPEELETWIVISGPQPPPAKLDVFAVIEKENVRRRGGVALLMT